MNTYSPDKNGYFVCKSNVLITNTALCKKQRPNKNSTNFETILLTNPECKKCVIDLTKINTVSLDQFDKLELELNEYINNIHNNSNFNKQAIY